MSNSSIKENLEIAVIYKDSNKMIMYGYYDGPLKNDSTLSMIYRWIDLHASTFSEQERKDLIIDKIIFPSLKAKISFIERYDFVYDITYYHGNENLPFTGYEATVYEETIQEWYEMYKTTVVAGQILPSIMFGDDKMNNVMQSLNDVSVKMYELVNDFNSFLSFVSTIHIKNALIVHPIVAASEYHEMTEQEELFRYQLFKDEPKNEEREVKR